MSDEYRLKEAFVLMIVEGRGTRRRS